VRRRLRNQLSHLIVPGRNRGVEHSIQKRRCCDETLRACADVRGVETGILLQRHTGTPQKIDSDLTHRAPIVDNSRRTGARAPRSYFSELSLKIQFVAWWARLRAWSRF